MNNPISNTWLWKGNKVSWSKTGSKSHISVILIHGFGASKRHWRHNQDILGNVCECYAIDLIGFGDSSQPKSRLKGEKSTNGDFEYKFDSWGEQIAAFTKEVVNKPVFLIGNSIGGIIALKAAQIIENNCKGIVLINCAQRAMDDKRLGEKSILINLVRPLLKQVVRQRFISSLLLKNAANDYMIRQVLKQAYPTGKNIDNELIKLLREPSMREGAAESFHGFINLFDDYLAPELIKKLKIPVHLIWGELDPWEPLTEAKRWEKTIESIDSLKIIKGCGHCPHDENPEEVNSILLKFIQEAI